MDTENGLQSKKLTGASYHFRTFQVSLNLLSHVLVGIIVGINLVFVFRLPLPLSETPQHIVLCVLGYQLLMAEAILSLSPYNTWSLHLKLVDKRRAHTVLQVVGSILAIVGSFIKIMEKANNPNSTNWSSLHGIFGLIALVFTVASLINGFASLYAHELRKCLPSKLSKITHICFGIVVFVSANICLCYGFEKGMFRNWVSPTHNGPIVNTLITFTALLTGLVVVAPLISFFQKFKTN
ncbi:hypothetical protein PYW07_012265 [Mythimna separata]|uniref:ascorbate ferrireductase (transmembrane) n=1 Tax=Mythimna separata TaxID=271217 RepID=A0AAD8DSB0_MYTSE|nr:hypothetical protein PYW07_012265 [Mythimna separata]